jgi:hypothetical protein
VEVLAQPVPRKCSFQNQIQNNVDLSVWLQSDNAPKVYLIWADCQQNTLLVPSQVGTAPWHTCTQHLLLRFRWKVKWISEKPIYSGDLTLCDFFLIPATKNNQKE